MHPSKCLFFDLSFGKRIAQCDVGLPIGAARPPTARAWMVTTVCAFQVASMPAPASNWMARIGVVRVVVWTRDIVQIAKASDL
jgi:hypothetical protein